MPKRLGALCDLFGELLTAGDVERLADLHLYPCPFVIDGRMIVIPDRAAFKLASAVWRAEQMQAGVRGYHGEVVAQELPRGAQFRAWLRWTHRMADGSMQEAGADVIYVTRVPGGHLRVEMVEVLSRQIGFVTLPIVAFG